MISTYLKLPLKRMKIHSNLLSLVVLSFAFSMTKCDDFVEKDGADTDRDLRHHGGGHGWGHHHHGDGFNKTEYLLEKCSNASIVCENIPAEDLAECSNITKCGYHGFHRDLTITFESEEDGEFYDFLEGIDLAFDDNISKQFVDLEKRKLRGGRRRKHGKGGKWDAHDGKGQCSGLNETEIETIKMKRLVCKCCAVEE
mmetsp:Transcript_19812/g.37500  ORF Transcript_19812/g.37500 Transcript_19812/m.37500 type:complete len:198 (+) Transcript_19812:108-701(+)